MTMQIRLKAGGLLREQIAIGGEWRNAIDGATRYFYTRDLARAFRVGRTLESGMVGINRGFITTEVAPFGGIKDSGVGREGSSLGIEEFLHVKYLNLGGS